MSLLNAEMSFLRESITHLKKANSELQEQLRKSESVKVEMSYKLNQLFTENQMTSATVSQLKEQQLLF
jgi:predicted nuclease with TOPRIM domain